jgi:hypothetical protein
MTSSGCSEGLLSVDEGANTIDHILDKLLLREAESSLVGDVEDAGAGVGVLTVDTTGLALVLVADLVELLHLLAELGQLDVHGGSESGTKVGRARGDVTEMIVVSELGNTLDGRAGSAESVEDGLDVSTVLHGDDSELILLVDPDDERLGLVVEDTSARRPVSVEVASLEESVALLEEEMVVDELVLSGLIHALERVEGTLEVIIEDLGGLDDVVHDLKSLILGDTRAERIVSEVSADSDTGGVDHGSILLGELSILEALAGHVRLVLISGLVTVVLLNDEIKELVELGVRIVGAGIETDARVEVLHTREDASLEGDAACIRLVLVLIPHSRSKVSRESRAGAFGEEGSIVDEFIGVLPGSDFTGNLISFRRGALNALSGSTTSHLCFIYL